MGSDPVKVGLASLAWLGGNATGVTLIGGGLEAKRLALLRQLVPSGNLIAALINPDNVNAPVVIDELQSASKALHVTVHLLRANTDDQLDATLATLPQLKAAGILIVNDPFFLSRRDRIVAEMARIALPAAYLSREFTAAGGLVSYGSNLADMYRKSGVYVGRILNGEKSAGRGPGACAATRSTDAEAPRSQPRALPST
jgi:putative tryptophan/tyrosine transport system substrate-binding protein